MEEVLIDSVMKEDFVLTPLEWYSFRWNKFGRYCSFSTVMTWGTNFPHRAGVGVFLVYFQACLNTSNNVRPNWLHGENGGSWNRTEEVRRREKMTFSLSLFYGTCPPYVFLISDWTEKASDEVQEKPYDLKLKFIYRTEYRDYCDILERYYGNSEISLQISLNRSALLTLAPGSCIFFSFPFLFFCSKRADP